MSADSYSKIHSSSVFTNCEEKLDPFSGLKHAENTFRQFAVFYDQGKFTDIVLTGCDHRKFKVHSIVLAAASEHFCNVLFDDEKNYHLDFITSDTLEVIIHFCYTGHVQLSSKNIQSILLAADDLGMPKLKSICNQFLETTIVGDNALHYALIAERCGLESFEKFAEQYLLHNCAKLCESKNFSPWNLNKIDEVVKILHKDQCELYSMLMQSLESSSGENSSLMMNTYQAIYQTFFIGGYIHSLINTSEAPVPLIRQNTVDIVKSPEFNDSESNDEGLFIVAKSKAEGLEMYCVSQSNRSPRIIPKLHINTDKINIDTVKLFANRDQIIFSCIKEQKLIVKSWSFKKRTLIDIQLPSAVQNIKPRVTNAVGESFFVTEEKYAVWPYEGYKTIAYKFGLESENYKCIEINNGGIKEIIGISDEIFVFNQRAEVISFSLSGMKKMSRGILNHNGIIRAVIFRGSIYVGSYIRAKNTVFVELYNRKINQWITIGSIPTNKDSSNFHIGATDNFLYVFGGKGKIQRYNDISGRWSILDLPESFNQTVLCISTSVFTCVNK